MTGRELVGALKLTQMERLRWLVLQEFSVLPGSREARRMTDGRCLRIAAMLAAEKESGFYGEAECKNSAFDEEKFRKLREGG